MKWPFAFPRRSPPVIPKLDISRDERLGIIVRPGAWNEDAGHDWAWVEGQFEGQKYWSPTKMFSVCVRRKCWPIRYIRPGLELPDGDGQTLVTTKESSTPWRVWRESAVGDQSTFIGGLMQGWDGQIGADLDPDQWVPVCGTRQYDGRRYNPTDADLLAKDWELA